MSLAIRNFLLSSSLVSEADLQRAEVKAQKEKISFLHAVELMDVVPEFKLLDALSRFYGVPNCKLGEMEVPPPIIALFPKALAWKHRMIPIDRAGNNIIVAMADPHNTAVINAIRSSIGFFPKPVLGTERRLSEALEKYYGKNVPETHQFKPAAPAAQASGLAASATPTDKDSKLSKLVSQISVKGQAAPSSTQKKERQDIATSDKSDGPIIRIVNQVLMECLSRKASDIHIEPYETNMRIRLRIDGVLTEIARPPVSMKAPLTSRIKIMASLDISETRLPQDGAINTMIEGKPVDFRVSSTPTIYGEKIVMRILDKSNLQVDMTKLGFEQDQLDTFMKSIHSPFGMVLVTGPTGSGKTTTLYSALSELNTETENIMTAEDPVEYNLEGINQIGMKPDIGLTFAEALRSFLRQDPDIIMVGEIRDLETAEIAMKAALTGHLVLSTLHTNSAPDTIARLLNMGVESFNVVSALTCVTAQRLVRKICLNCRVQDESVTAQAMIELGIHPHYAAKVQAYKGAGCETCGGSGNKGRVAVHEVLFLNTPVKEAILANAPALHIKKIAMASGMRSLRQSALNKMAMGIIGAKEVSKATSSDSDDNGAKGGAAA